MSKRIEYNVVVARRSPLQIACSHVFSHAVIIQLKFILPLRVPWKVQKSFLVFSKRPHRPTVKHFGWIWTSVLLATGGVISVTVSSTGHTCQWRRSVEKDGRSVSQVSLQWRLSTAVPRAAVLFMVLWFLLTIPVSESQYRRLEKNFVLPSIFDASLSSLIM